MQAAPVLGILTRTVLIFGLLLSSGSAWARPHHEVEVPQDSREFFVDEAKLPFDGILGLPSTRE